ncbi:lactococcin 972 family bacteriocin [Streptococcus iners]|uniref:Lactococcin 972 family bacteriocin n=1 Tax=Streptococcus iners TaxID=3028084 RepID=A0AA97AE64_9STRE|nr:lactococcin 972 family bacteriocin [Streptococcus sp. 29887]MCK4024781.1 lactococcin 972 family bacteriocin [Streptococcus suis]NQN49701.1 lactococcin 972 family bacteriocin [Streptococcus suis]WNY51051.1 lactococcin 972 family bacteriocin [Streptococcus sp. 29887]
MKKTLKKFALIAGLAATIGGTAVASAAVQYPGGGVWTYGAANGGAYSNYYHSSRYHSSTVVSRWTGASSKGYAQAGQTSRAWISTKRGEKAAFYYNY